MHVQALQRRDPETLEGKFEFVLDLVVDLTADEDASIFCQRLDPRRNVNSVAQNVTLRLHNVAHVNADSKVNRELWEPRYVEFARNARYFVDSFRFEAIVS